MTLKKIISGGQTGADQAALDAAIKVTFTIIILFAVLFFPWVSTFADCRGCCSRHGGVTCIDGVTQCRDGTPLSTKCSHKGCSKCANTSITILSKVRHVEQHLVPDAPCSMAIPTSSSADSFKCNGHVAFGIPGPEEQLLCRQGYAVGYDYETKVPRWVAYRLTSASVNKRNKRSNRFTEDFEIPPKYRSTLDDYRRSGYDRGHMAASATIDFSVESMQESFLMSNMAPQLPGFNRQGWRILEEEIRSWTNERDELYVVTGCLFEGSPVFIGNGVSVPSHFFKVVYAPHQQDAIAFLIPHMKISQADLPKFIVSVDTVEHRTGLDFNRLLDDKIENEIEDDVERMW